MTKLPCCVENIDTKLKYHELHRYWHDISDPT